MQPIPSTVRRPGPPVRLASVELSRILTISDDFSKHLAHQLGVNSTDLEAMKHLIRSGELAPTEIARRLGVTTAAVTAATDRLVKLGHVTRAPNPNDRRGILISATPDSRSQALAVLLPMIAEVDGVLDDFSLVEQDVIARYLGRVADVYAAHTSLAAAGD